MVRNPSRVLLFLAAAILSLPATFAHAALLNTVEVTLTPTDAGGTGPLTQTTDAGGAFSLSHAVTGGLASSANGSAHVAPGIIQLQGTAFGSIDVRARAVYRDTFTITSPGIATGTNGNLQYNVAVDGAMDATTGITQSKWTLNAAVGTGAGTLALLASGNVQSPGSPDLGDPVDPFITYSRNVPFQFGVPTTLAIELIGTISARYDATSHAGAGTFNFGQDVFWQGISNIKPVGGTPVDQSFISSDTGTNWLLPVTLTVPEPGTLCVMLLGAGALVLPRRGSKGRQA